jgi:hypothetical protein
MQPKGCATGPAEAGLYVRGRRLELAGERCRREVPGERPAEAGLYVRGGGWNWPASAVVGEVRGEACG